MAQGRLVCKQGKERRVCQKFKTAVASVKVIFLVYLVICQNSSFCQNLYWSKLIFAKVYLCLPKLIFVCQIYLFFWPKYGFVAKSYPCLPRFKSSCCLDETHLGSVLNISQNIHKIFHRIFSSDFYSVPQHQYKYGYYSLSPTLRPCFFPSIHIFQSLSSTNRELMLGSTVALQYSIFSLAMCSVPNTTQI